MKKILIGIFSIVVAFFVVNSTHAVTPQVTPQASPQAAIDHYGPFNSTSADNGSCGETWANDTFDRYFTVQNTGNNTFTMREDYKNGTFTTLDAVSPGMCTPNSNRHGSTISAGITGTMTGNLTYNIQNATYNPNGCSTGDCSSTIGFIQAVFGTGATMTCPVGSCFNFDYSSNDQSLQYRHWQDKSASNGTGEQFIGDIATQ